MSRGERGGSGLSRGEWALLSTACLLMAVFITSTSFVVDGELYFSLFDDAMISMRYARHLVEGHGLVWNPGESPKVEGYTNLLWTLVMAGVHLLPVSSAKTSLVVMVLGALLVVATAWTTRLLVRDCAPESQRAPSLAFALTLFHYPLLYWTCLGMEVGFLCWLLALCLRVAFFAEGHLDSRRALQLALLFAAMLLTRADVLPIVTTIAAYVVTCQKQRRAQAALTLGTAIAVPLLGHTAFRWSYYGELLPNTYYLKVEGTPWPTRLRAGAWALFRILAQHLLPYLLLAAGALRRAWQGLAPWRDADSRHNGSGGSGGSARLLLLCALPVVQFAYSAYMGGDAWQALAFANRYITVAAPALMALCALGAERLTTSALSPLWRGALLLQSAALGLRGVYLLWSYDQHAGSASPLLSAQPAARLTEGIALCVIALPLLLTAVPVAPLRRAWMARRQRGLAAIALATVAMLISNGRALGYWVAEGVNHDVEPSTRVGIHLANTTQPNTTIAVLRAGATPYFADRAAVDLLGKCDKQIARSTTVEKLYRAGHNKYDLRHSIGELRPDVIVEYRRHPRFRSEELFRQYGYQRLENGLFVHEDASQQLLAGIAARW